MDDGADLRDGADELAAFAADVLHAAKRAGCTLVTAESCTGGLLASLLTDIEGLGHVFERGFVVYTDEAKTEMLGVDPLEINRHGAVSAAVADAMARGALDHSRAGIAIAITGFAGPAGPDDEVGLVHLAVLTRSGEQDERVCHFGDVGRDRIRQLSVRSALELVDQLLTVI